MLASLRCWPGTVAHPDTDGHRWILIRAAEARCRNAAPQGKRAALPSATIMLRQPIQRFQQMQASDIDIYRNELRKTNAEIVRAAFVLSISSVF